MPIEFQQMFVCRVQIVNYFEHVMMVEKGQVGVLILPVVTLMFKIELQIPNHKSSHVLRP